jgi:two-component sensor histidine kinase
MTATAMTCAGGNEIAVAVLPPLAGPDMVDEMNHRIANSLQLLCAMVSADARQVGDPVALATLEMAQRRIGAIARVHRQLYQAQGFGRVRLATYLRELGCDLEDSFGHARTDRHILVEAGDVAVSPEDASLLGVLVCELVGNACKYAYASDARGNVHVRLTPAERGGYRLEVEDRGLGRDGMTVRGTQFGTRLIESIADRLGAVYAWEDARPGTRFVLVGRAA